MSKKPKNSEQSYIPMVFRLVARNDKWEVETAVKPNEGMELEFIVDRITPRKDRDV